MWILLALLAALTAAINTTLSKAGLKTINPILAFAIQSVLILAVAWGAAFAHGNVAQVKEMNGRTWLFLIIAGVITAVSSLLTFHALKLGEASQVSPVERLSLVFAVILAAIFLKEKITWQVILGVVLMAAGAIVIALAKKAS